ncbi:hypothetical protein L207DRAFT_340168 [Hyaloscypha variabilis F]|uniref:Uncharacterized protein n=1 Tax=Hyaloscypha variabilis (strain UAMH 11265 / GT02V1 / F) TaxID=1149755 RepID=A0A2J6RPS6_HYAVF|nr:hypothetical protein L207DRAFT_340168 [Hyaloscypha variabilis F]
MAGPFASRYKVAFDLHRGVVRDGFGEYCKRGRFGLRAGAGRGGGDLRGGADGFWRVGLGGAPMRRGACVVGMGGGRGEQTNCCVNKAPWLRET